VSYGQARILIGRESIDDRLAGAGASPRERQKLSLIVDVRAYARDVIGLAHTSSYTTIFDTEGEAAAWNLSACPDDSFTPYTWTFPFVGEMPYKGYFFRAPAEEEGQDLRARHMDVVVRPVAAYSTLGWLSDPIFTPMLAETDEFLANTIVHELAHATVFIEKDAEFNETLATFIGNQGSRDYFEARGGTGDLRISRASDTEHDEDVLEVEIKALRSRLEAIYALPIPRPEKLRQKADALRDFREHYKMQVRPKLRASSNCDWILSVELNNALILGLERYHGDLGIFLALHKKLGSNLRSTVLKLREIADTENPRATLTSLAKS
jgi:predicted aminopeptidase